MNSWIKNMVVVACAGLILALASSCFVVDTPECHYDDDCWSPADACIRGECAFVGAPKGYATVECNCSYTYDLPGSVYENNYCYSGLEIMVECASDCCNQYICYPAWAIVCL